ARRLAAEQLAEDRVGILGGDVQVQEALDLRHRQDRGRRRRLGLLDEPDERRGLAALVGVLGGEDGYQEVGGDVDEERPEDAVAHRVEPLEREERGRAEPADAERAGRRRRRRNGRTMSLEIIFESARESTTIMAVAAEKPPRNTVTATSPASARSGSARMKLSAAATSPNVRRPPKAMGSTKTLIARR